MGGKKKGGSTRTKGNTRPSNSGRSAAKLAESGASGFVGFPTWQGEPSYIPATQGNEELDATVDADFRLVMRKMSKRDTVTKLKAIQEFTSLCKEKDQGAVKSILPFWPRVFNKLSMDHERRIREAMFQALEAIVLSIQKHLAPYLRSIMGCWLLGQCDSYAPAASAATRAFHSAFPPSKQVEALIFCKKEIMTLIEDNLLYQNASSMSEAEFLTEEEINEKYLRIVSSTMYAWKLFLNSVPKEEQVKLKDSYEKILINDIFWKYHKHKSQLVRGSWFSLISTLCQIFPNLTTSSQKLFPIILNNLDDPSPLVAPFVWEAATSAISNIEDCWNFINIHKTLIPKLKNVSRKSCNGNAVAICPCLLTLFKKIPSDFIIEEKHFYHNFFSDLRQGIFLEKVTSSHSELNSLLKCFMECLTHAIEQLIILSFKEAEMLLLQQLLPIVQSSLEDPNVKQMCPHLNKLFYEFLMSLYCSGDENLRVLHESLWKHLGLICRHIMEEESLTMNSLAIDRMTELFLTLQISNKKLRTKYSSVHFVEADQTIRSSFQLKDIKTKQHKTTDEIQKTDSLMECYINNRSNPFHNQLQNVILLALDGTVKLKSLSHLKCLAKLSLEFSSPELFAHLLSHRKLTEKTNNTECSAYVFFETFTKPWIMSSKIEISTDKEFAEIFGNLTLASYFAAKSSETKHLILTTISKTEKPFLIEAFLRMIIPQVTTDGVLLAWLKGEELSASLISIARRLCNIIITDDVISSREIDSIWSLLTFVLSAECLISESCLGLMLDVFRLALPKPGSADLKSTKQLEPVLHFVIDLATQIFDNFKDCWQIPTTEELLITLFLLSTNPPSNISESTLNKIQDCWTNGVKALLSCNGLTYFENSFLSKCLKSITFILSNKLTSNNTIIASSINILKCIKKHIDSSCGVTQEKNVLAYLRWIIPSEKNWQELRNQLGNEWMLKALQEEILTTIEFSTLKESLSQSKSDFGFLQLAAFTCNLLQNVLVSEIFSTMEKKILSSPAFLFQLKEILFAVAYYDMVQNIIAGEVFSWLDFGHHVKESFIYILSNLNATSAEELFKEVFILSHTKGNMWSVAFHILSDLYENTSTFTVTLDDGVHSIIFQDGIEKIHTLQAIKKVPFTSVNLQTLCAKLNLCENNWDLKTATNILAVATKLASSDNIDETEIHETLLKILNVIISWRDLKTDFFMFSSHLTSANDDEIHFNYEVQRFLIHLIPKFSAYLNREQWDFILCGLYSWLQTCFEEEFADLPSVTCLLLMQSTCLLLHCISHVITNAISDEMNHSTLITEWNEFFSDGLYSILLPNAVAMAVVTIKDGMSYIKVQLLNSLMIAMETIPEVYLENHKLSSSRKDDIKDKDNPHIPQHLQILLHQLGPLFLSGVRSVQMATYKIFLKIIPLLKNYEDKLERIEDKEQNARKLPLAFLNILTETTKTVNSFVAEMATNGQCSALPDSPMFHYTMGYLLVWNIVMELFSSASSELRSEYASYLQESGLMHDLLANLFFLISENASAIECCNSLNESPSKSLPQTLFSVKPKLNIIGDSSWTELIHHACYVYFLSVKKLPVLVRQWWNNQDKRISTAVDKITSKYVTPLLCADEFQSVQNSEKKFENMMVRARLSAKEVVATYVIDEVSMELIIKLSSNHPLGPVIVECGKRVGVGNTQWRNWMLQLNTFLIHQNGSLLDGLTLWKQNVDKKFEGIEECYICYYILHGSNCQLPRLMCRTCKKKFHSACLDKDLCVLKHLTREENRFNMSAEIKAIFTNFISCLEAVNVLTEKLDKSVHISYPVFSHSFSKLEQLKQEVCLQAVKNAQCKAEKIATFLQTCLGPPISILEEEYFEGPRINENSNNISSTSIQELLNNATVTLECKVLAKFAV